MIKSNYLRGKFKSGNLTLAKLSIFYEQKVTLTGKFKFFNLT